MSLIELTEEQRQNLEAGQGGPVDVIDPVTSRRYVLLAREQYERVRTLLPPNSVPRSSEEDTAEIAPGILRSQQAFWRDLPELLKRRRNRDKWVCYHGDECVGIGDHDALVRECLRRGIPSNEYYLGHVSPRELPPWEPEEVEPLRPWHRDHIAPDA